jgi:hypothetical protein
MSNRIDVLEDALREIEEWSRAYPYRVFPEPDLKRVAEVLALNNMTLDSVSASITRHVIDGVGRIAREALAKAGST